jgi:hypothetical protein
MKLEKPVHMHLYEKEGEVLLSCQDLTRIDLFDTNEVKKENLEVHWWLVFLPIDVPS